MKNYLVFEKEVENQYRRNLITLEEAFAKISGYLNCMVDMCIISSDRVSEEIEVFYRKVV